jgi:hypothetical protein
LEHTLAGRCLEIDIANRKPGVLVEKRLESLFHPAAVIAALHEEEEDLRSI